MRKNKYLYVALALVIFLPSFLSYPGVAKTEKIESKVTSKDEVVYATLNASGELNHIYVVNTLEVARAGEILDYGEYSSVKNLTDLTKLVHEEQKVIMEAPEGKFYYQGNMKVDNELPWNIKVSYLLDGQKVKPSELAGKTGHVEINIELAQNQNGNSVFYDNYLLQVSLILPNTYQNIETSGGMIANAGKNKQITFTVMPGQEESLTVQAEVEDFEFQGIEIAAVPSSLPIDTSEMENMTEDMSALSDAIGELNKGVADLKNGVTQLNNGTASLRDGSGEFKGGISSINRSSPEIVKASSSIREALETIYQSLSNESADMDLTSLKELPAGLIQVANGLTETANGLSAMQKNYSSAYAALDGAIKEIPADQLSEEEIAGLYQSGASTEVLDKLVASYSASQKVRRTYDHVKEGFAAVKTSLTQASESIRLMSGQLTSIATNLSGSIEETDGSGLSELQKGLAALSANYRDFHSGLVGYTEGIHQVSASYDQLHSGILKLTGGTSELEDGANQLQSGTEELYEETKDLPNQMQEEINQMIKEYDKSDFEPVSFVSSENEKISSVQFVIKTESIQKEEPVTKKTEPEKEKGFWELLMELFKG
ncbi:YhgE/Pip domain-containing protein [Bacillus salitolerans]|uniref:YhgE/Pip domain-containing protein n=1 Tax=Bacillus salitolerans TaxID=1437434 RepID=A0ABW4LTQ5_9BACI